MITHKNGGGNLPPKLRKPEMFNVLTSPYWLLVFILLSVPIFLLAGQVSEYLGLGEFTPEQRNAVFALFSGIGADIFLRRWLKVALVITRSPPLPFVIAWVVAAIFVFAFQPFERFF